MDSPTLPSREEPMRKTLTTIHRILGLSTALFLFLAGLSGSILVFYRELEALINPTYFALNSPSKTPLSLHEQSEILQKDFPEARIRTILIPQNPDQPTRFFLRHPKGQEAPSQIAMHPDDGSYSQAEYNGIMRWLYQFHHTLSLGKDGNLIMGIVALAWFFDLFVALVIALPKPARGWQGLKESFQIKWQAGWFRILFDLHRAMGLWIWLVLLMLAFTGVYFNLRSEVFLPTLNLISPRSENPVSAIKPTKEPLPPQISWDEALLSARHHFQTRGLPVQPAMIQHNGPRQMYVLRFHSPKNPAADHPITFAWVSDQDGAILHHRVPSEGTLADSIVEWQFALHSGRGFGWFGRLLVFLAGIATSILSVTGVLIWLRKRKGRKAMQARLKAHRSSAEELRAARASA